MIEHDWVDLLILGLMLLSIFIDKKWPQRPFSAQERSERSVLIGLHNLGLVFVLLWLIASLAGYILLHILHDVLGTESRLYSLFRISSVISLVMSTLAFRLPKAPLRRAE